MGVLGSKPLGITQIISGGDGESLTGPLFTYTDGVLTKIDYDDGTYKELTYTDGVLTQIDKIKVGDPTIRKTFVYSGDVLMEIIQTTL